MPPVGNRPCSSYAHRSRSCSPSSSNRKCGSPPSTRACSSVPCALPGTGGTIEVIKVTPQACSCGQAEYPDTRPADTHQVLERPEIRMTVRPLCLGTLLPLQLAGALVWVHSPITVRICTPSQDFDHSRHLRCSGRSLHLRWLPLRIRMRFPGVRPPPGLSMRVRTSARPVRLALDLLKPPRRRKPAPVL